MIRRVSVAVALAAATAGCFGGGEPLTATGAGSPRVTVDFPTSAPPGSVQEATFEVVNPGPRDMSGVAVSFARVGNDFPIVDVVAGNGDPAVVEVSPEPVSVDRAGTTYRFGALDEGEGMQISFLLRLPDRRGVVANSVTVSAAEDLSRIYGVRLQTEIR
ncbi:MAG TPA: hypothetical protein VM573_04375 [Actinomycetota bacterium]|nr:hypothetical protein [Actinomycetota bacterium]